MSKLDLFTRIVAAIENEEVVVLWSDPDEDRRRVASGTLISPKTGVQGILHEESGTVLHYFYTTEVKSVDVFGVEPLIFMSLKDPADEVE